MRDVARQMGAREKGWGTHRHRDDVVDDIHRQRLVACSVDGVEQAWRRVRVRRARLLHDVNVAQHRRREASLAQESAAGVDRA